MNKSYTEERKKTAYVVIITLITMFVEIFYGYITNSMALLSDGWHMSSHAFALGLSWFVYGLANNENIRNKINTKKLLSLSGFSSAILLLIMAFWLIFESVLRFFNKQEIDFSDAIIVAIIGLFVNLICAYILKENHHHNEDNKKQNHHHQDNNMKSAYLHVIADAFTSLLAIFTLTIGLKYKINWLDAVGGIIGAVVILKWAISLIKSTGKHLTDYKQ